MYTLYKCKGALKESTRYKSPFFLLPFFFFKENFISLFISGCAVFVALHRLSLAVASGGYSLVVVCGLLILVSSLAPAPGLRLSSCRPWALLLRSLWNLPGLGVKPVSPALAGRFLTAGPPGKSSPSILPSFLFFLPPFKKK